MLFAVATLLKSQNLHMLSAIDGIDTGLDTPAPLITDTARDEPALFFWVLFGLSYEALCTSPPPAGDTPPALVQAIALEALTGLIRPEVSGSALLQASLFEELCNLCYRLAITEGPEIKLHVMEIAVQLATSFSADLLRQEKLKLVSISTQSFLRATILTLYFSRSNGAISDLISNDSKMTQCLRVATCVLQESIPSFTNRGESNAT